MSDREREIRLFERAADQRLTTAEFLLKHGFLVDSVYLAGYAVECALKALVLRWTPRREFDATREKLTQVGAKGHDFEYLKGVLKERRRAKDKSDREVLGVLAIHLKVVASWSTDLRYQVGTLSARRATAFFDAAKAIRDACARS